MVVARSGLTLNGPLMGGGYGPDDRSHLSGYRVAPREAEGGAELERRWLRGAARAFQNRHLAPVSQGVHTAVGAGLDANLKGAGGAPMPTHALPTTKLSGPENDCRGAA